MAIKYIGLLESPIPLKIELIMLYAVIKGIPRKQILKYIAVPAAASCGVDMTLTMPFTEKNKTIVNTIESIINNVTVFPVSAAALFLSLAPIACPILTVAPIARPTIITVSMCIT